MKGHQAIETNYLKQSMVITVKLISEYDRKSVFKVSKNLISIFEYNIDQSLLSFAVIINALKEITSEGKPYIILKYCI